MEHPQQGRRSAVVQTALAVLLSGSLVLFTVLATSIGLRTGPRGGLRAIVPEGAAGITLPANRPAGSSDASSAAGETAATEEGTPVASLPVGTFSTGSTSLLPAPGASDDVIAPPAPADVPTARGGAGVAVGDADEAPEGRTGSLVLRSTEPSSTTSTTDEEPDAGEPIDEETGDVTGDSSSTESEVPPTQSEVPPNVPNDANEADGGDEELDGKNKSGVKKTNKAKGNKSSKKSKGNKKGSSHQGVDHSRSGPKTTKSTTGRAGGGSKPSNSSQPKQSESKSTPPPSKPAKKKSSSSGDSDGGRPEAPEGGEKKKIRRKD